MEAALWRSDAAFASLATFPLVAAGGFWYLPVVDETAFRKLVSGERRGPAAAGFRYVLWLMQWPYRAVIGTRNLGYRLRIFPSHSVEAPVISVGNLTTGGTGKCNRLVIANNASSHLHHALTHHRIHFTGHNRTTWLYRW